MFWDQDPMNLEGETMMLHHSPTPGVQGLKWDER